MCSLAHTAPTLPHCQEVKEAAITAMATLVASLADELPAEVPKVRVREAFEERAAYRVSQAHYPPPPSSLLVLHSRPGVPSPRRCGRLPTYPSTMLPHLPHPEDYLPSPQL